MLSAAVAVFVLSQTVCGSYPGGEPGNCETKAPGGPAAPGGGGPPIPFPFPESEGPCDESVSHCRGESSEEKQCRKIDREIDMAARAGAEILRDLCFPERGGDGNEHGIAITRDRYGNLSLTDDYSNGSPDFVRPELGVAEAGGDLRVIVAFMHCHPAGDATLSGSRRDPIGDWATVQAYGQTIAGSTDDDREDHFRSYVVGRDEIGEGQYTNEEGCEADVE